MLDFYEESNKNVIFFKILFYICFSILNYYLLNLNFSSINCLLLNVILILNNLFPIIYSLIRLYDFNFFEVFYTKLNQENIQKIIYELYLIVSIIVYFYNIFLPSKKSLEEGNKKYSIIITFILVSCNLYVDYFKKYEDIRNSLLIKVTLKYNTESIKIIIKKGLFYYLLFKLNKIFKIFKKICFSIL